MGLNNLWVIFTPRVAKSRTYLKMQISVEELVN